MADDERARNQEDDEQELKVKDRRLFTADGQLRADVVSEEPEDEQPRDERPTGAESGTAVEAEQEAGFEHRPIEEPEGVDFTMLINAMAEPALLFLGEIPHPATGKPHVDLERARIQVDMLDLLRVKCRGNLTADEDGLLDHVLYKLRMAYVQRANQPEE